MAPPTPLTEQSSSTHFPITTRRTPTPTPSSTTQFPGYDTTIAIASESQSHVSFDQPPLIHASYVPRSISAIALPKLSMGPLEVIPSSHSFHPFTTDKLDSYLHPAKRPRHSLSQSSPSPTIPNASGDSMHPPAVIVNPTANPTQSPTSSPDGENHPFFTPNGMSLLEVMHSFNSACPVEKEFVKEVMNYDKVRQLQEELANVKREHYALRRAVTAARNIIVQKDGYISAQDTQLQGIKEALDCSICMTLYDQPYFLSCGHTFCLNCLQSWFASIAESHIHDATLLRTNTCPMCRTIVLIPIPAHALRIAIEQLELYSQSSGPESLYTLQMERHKEQVRARERRSERLKSKGAHMERDEEWFLDQPTAGEDRYRAAPPPSEVVWEGVFEEELEPCLGCGGVAKSGFCLGFIGVHGRDSVLAYQSHSRAGSGFRDGSSFGPASGSHHSQYVHLQTLQQLEGAGTPAT